jgi:hypothetical protein
VTSPNSTEQDQLDPLTKSGRERLLALGFDPIVELVQLYGQIEKDLKNETWNRSHVFINSMRGTQANILNSLMPYAYEKVDTKVLADSMAEPVLLVVPGDQDNEESRTE